MYLLMQDSPKGYFRLTPEQPLGLKYASCSISLEEVIRDPSSGEVKELIVQWAPQHSAVNTEGTIKRPKAYAHWVSDPVTCTMRFYKER